MSEPSISFRPGRDLHSRILRYAKQREMSLTEVSIEAMEKLLEGVDLGYVEPKKRNGKFGEEWSEEFRALWVRVIEERRKHGKLVGLVDLGLAVGRTASWMGHFEKGEFRAEDVTEDFLQEALAAIERVKGEKEAAVALKAKEKSDMTFEQFKMTHPDAKREEEMPPVEDCEKCGFLSTQCACLG